MELAAVPAAALLGGAETPRETAPLTATLRLERESGTAATAACWRLPRLRRPVTGEEVRAAPLSLSGRRRLRAVTDGGGGGGGESPGLEEECDLLPDPLMISS